MAKNHPESLDEINQIEVTDEIRSFVANLSNDVEDERGQRSHWEQRQDKNRDLRYGIRAKKNHPWPNAANFSIPLIDTDINRLKPAYVNLAYSVSPIVTFEPFGSEDVDAARKREQLFDWRMRTKVKFFKPYVLGVDKMLEQGQTVFKVIWKFSTRKYTERIDINDFDEPTLEALFDPRVTDELLFRIIQEELRVDLEHDENVEAINKAVKDFRDGKTELEIELVETADNQPEVIPCDLREDLVVPVDTLDINDARFIDYIYPVTVNELKIAMKDGKFEQYDDDTIQSWAKKAPQQRISSTVLEEPDEVIWLHESCVWKDINDDGIEERCITTWPDAQPEQVLRFIENPYDHGMWPYVQVRRELNDSGFYTSRGIPELDHDFQVGISTFFNQAVDNGTITNMPQVVYKKNSLVNKRNIRYVPGERIEVKSDINDYQVRQMTNVSQPAQLQLTQFLKNWSDQRNGNQTSGVSDLTNLAGNAQGGNKTAKEIELVSGLQQQVQSLDLQVFQQQMATVYLQIDALYEQFGDEEEEIIVTGQEPLRVSRREIQGKFNVVPNGRLDNSNPQLRLNKAVTALRLFINDPFINQKDLRSMVAEELEPRMADILVKSDQQVQQEQAQAIIAQQQAKEEAVQQRLLSDNLDIRKESMLVPVHGKKFAAD